MQWLATPLNALDSAIDRLTTPQRGGAASGDDDEEGTSNAANAAAGARPLVLDDDARAAAAEDDGFAPSSSSLGVGNGFGGAQLDIGPLDAGTAGGDDRSVTQQTIDINDAMGVISPLQHDNDGDNDGEEGAFVNGVDRRSMPPSRGAIGRAPPLPLHPDSKLRGSGAAIATVPTSAMDESQYVLETPPARTWPPQPKVLHPPQPTDAAAVVGGPSISTMKPPLSQSKRSAQPASSKASRTSKANDAGGSDTAVGISPFPGRLVKRARPPSPVNSLTEQEEAQVKTGVEGYLSSFVGGDNYDDGGGGGDTGNAAVGDSSDAVNGDDAIAKGTNQEEADRIRIAQEEDARLKAERVETERQRQRKKEKDDAERQRVADADAAAAAAAAAAADAEEKARLELLEATRIAEAKAAAEREAAVKAEMERQLREEAARRIAEQRRAEAEQKAREEEVRRIAAAAEEEARRRKAEEEAKLALEAEAKRQAQEEAERRRAVAEEQARVAAEQARVAAEVKAESDRRLQEVEEQRLQKDDLNEVRSKIQAPPVSAFTTGSSGVNLEAVEGELNDTSRDDDVDSEYEDYEVHLPLQPWDVPLVNIGKDGHDDGAVADISSFSTPLPSWDPAMNRRGVVQIRLFRAQRLPCAAGRSVRANITLPPWRGKVTTEWTKAYLGPEGIPADEDHSFEDVGAGVCARWDEEDIVEPNKEGTGDDFDEVSSDAQNAAVMTYNMVHHYNDTETPVPEISIELTSTSMLGFESTMSVSVPLSVGVLMREPGIWRRRWCPALAAGKDGAAQPSSPRRTVSGAVRGNGESPQSFARRKITAEAFYAYGTAEALGPLFLLEARFVPTSLNNGKEGNKEEDDSDFASAHGNLDDKGIPSRQEASASFQPDGDSVPSSNHIIGEESNAVSKATLPTHGMTLESPLTITSIAAPVAKPPRPTLDAFMQAEEYKHHADSDVQSVTSALTASTATKSQRRILQAKPHHLRVLPSWSSPTWCSICTTFVVPFRITCYQCETCNIVCCTDCQLRVDVRLPCGSDESKEAAEIARRSTVGGALGELMSVVAPVDEKVDDGIKGKVSDSLVLGKTDQTRRTGLSQDSIDGVASFRIKLVRACLFDRPYAPETDLDYILKKEGRALRVGDHYARITWTGSGSESKRTRTVFQTARPLFDSEAMVFDM